MIKKKENQFSYIATPNLLPIPSSKKIVVTDCGNDIAPQIISILRLRGIQAELVFSVPAKADFVIFLGGLRRYQHVDQAIKVNEEAFRAAKNVAERFEKEGGTFVCVSGDSGVVDDISAAKQGLSALCKTLQIEWPKSTCRHLSFPYKLHSANEIAHLIVHELLLGGSILDVENLGEELRLIPEFVACDKEDVQGKEWPLPENSVLLVTGGARGVTAEIVKAIAKQKPSKFILLGRSKRLLDLTEYRSCQDAADVQKLIMEKYHGSKSIKEMLQLTQKVVASIEIEKTLNSLMALGSEGYYFAVDVMDYSACRGIVDEIRGNIGKISGFIHGAGIIADKRVLDKTIDSYKQVFQTKVVGFLNILRALEDEALSLLAALSSMASLVGNEGQSDYAMANEVLNHLVQSYLIKHPNCLGKSFAFGPWQGGMVTKELQALFTTRSIPLLPLELGAAMFVHEFLDNDPKETVVLIGNNPHKALAPSAKEEHMFFDILVQQQIYPYLESHSIEGNVVVPMVLVLEWFTQSLQKITGQKVCGFKDLIVYKGAKVQNFYKYGNIFRVKIIPLEVNWIIELLDVDLKVLYRAEGETRDVYTQVAKKEFVWNEKQAGIGHSYQDSSLFHGPDFQVLLRTAETEDGCFSAVLDSVQNLDWPKRAWEIDVAALDGGLQLALLWTKKMLGQDSLPTRIEKVEYYSAPMGLKFCNLVGKEFSGQKGRCDVYFYSEIGAPVVGLLGIETHSWRRENKAFTTSLDAERM